MNCPGTVAVCVITFRRPRALQRLLLSLRAQEVDFPWRLIVVDNDASASAREVVEAVRLPVSVEYVVEARPGIPAARNRCLDLLRPHDGALAFIDDDEYASNEWLARLVDARRRYGTPIVAAPVISVFPPEAPRWLVRWGFLQRLVRQTGSGRGTPATGNALVDADLLRRSGVRFSEDFSETGGSDTELFQRLRRVEGARWVWCAEASVFEEVPQRRLTFGWITKRGIRGGNVIGRIKLQETSGSLVLMGGALRLVLGPAATLVAAAFRPRWVAFGVALTLHGIGMISSCFGRNVREYARGK